ncbi:D-sedoheptulose 7-phosphate isomerase [Labilibaculum sp.]|uniref:D-sedoheptulose 7-phosphate isomerase n=1 Tax=Labilibaculum sp. TaxID=2060723 RepID=UPI0035694412
MSIKDIKESFLDAQKVLNEFISDEQNFSAIEKAGEAMLSSLKAGGKVISCGNGGSMCDAMHFAEELTGRFRKDRPSMPAVAISDPSHITCVANDYGFDYIFSRYVEGMGQKGDVLLGISTSGNSANIINAITAAKEKEMIVVGLTGKSGGEMASLCDIEIRVPWMQYSDRVQEIHIKVIHCLIQYIESKMKYV